jgi:branched-subunit amino acid transport protein AzlD
MLLSPFSHFKTLHHFVTAVRWGQYLKLIGYFGFVSIFGICLIPNPEFSNALLRILILLMMLAYCFKECADTPANWRRAKQAYTQTKSILRATKELLPAEFRGWWHTFIRMQIACFKCPKANHVTDLQDQAISLSYLKNGMYTSLLPILIVACFADIPLTQFALHLHPIDSQIVVLIHSISITATILTITSLIGDKRLIAQGHHYIDQNILKLRLGARAQADIPMDLIRSIEIIDKKDVVIFNTQLNTMEVTPFDKANLVIHLYTRTDCQTRARFEELGSNRANVEHIKLYLDHPEALLSNWKKRQA